MTGEEVVELANGSSQVVQAALHDLERFITYVGMEDGLELS